MPHKHTRKRGDLDKSTYAPPSTYPPPSPPTNQHFHSIDLPPTVLAKPLPVSKSANANGVFTSELSNPRRENKKRKRNKDAADDTPKAFSRLMAFRSGKKLPSGLDDGNSGPNAAKKRKRAAGEKKDGESTSDDKAKLEEPAQPEMPTIRVGESMSDFAARVDAALPVSGLINKTARGGKDPLGLKVTRTKTEKRMHRMYDEWREQDRKIKEQREEALDLAEMETVDDDGQVRWKDEIEGTGKSTGKKGKGKGKNKKKVRGEIDDGNDDPWEQLKRNRAEAKAGLHDVAQAPPTFSRVPKAKFRALGARVEVDDVPKASGSLRRREELGEERKSVVEAYRAMMAQKSASRAEEA